MTMDNVVWQGGVNAWECDEMGHMNSRFYIARAMEGIQVLFAQLGLPDLFRHGAEHTLVPTDLHIRFHRESAAGMPLRMTGDILDISASTAEVLLMIFDAGGERCKVAMRAELSHVRAQDGHTRVAWPEGFASRAYGRRTILPDVAKPRSTATGKPETSASLARAEELGLRRISLGAITCAHVDAFGRMQPHWIPGVVSDGVRSLGGPFREIALRHSDDPPTRCGGAVLEFRILHLDWPRVGDCYEVRSGLHEVSGNVRSLIHWVLDPCSGRPYGVMQGTGVDFDLDRRRILPLTEAARQELRAHCVPGLSL